VPKIDEARMRADQADRLRKRRGRAANILAGDTGIDTAPGTKTLLGQ